MSYGTLGDRAIPDRLLLEYAPTGRASCKTCGSAIGQDTVKMGEKVRSPWHDGFDIRWHHATVRCGLRHAANSVHDFKGFQRLRWVDQVAIAEKVCPGSSAPAQVKRLNEMVWEVKGVRTIHAVSRPPGDALSITLSRTAISTST